MKKDNFPAANIEEHNMDPVSQLLIKQNLNEFKQNQESTRKAATPKANLVKTKLKYGDLVIDQLAHIATYNGQDLLLANREYEVLLYLALHVNTIVTFEEIGKQLFGTYSEGDRQSVMVNVSRLRKKMQMDVHLENMLETHRNVGYRLIYKQ